MSLDTVDALTFEQLFFDSTRSQLNWHRLRREGWTACVRPIGTREALGDLRLPWIRDGDLMDVGAKQLRVAKAAQHMARFSQKRRDTVLDLARAFSAGNPSALAFPALRAKDTYLLLDGCHRAVALYLAAEKPRVALFVLNAPADASTVIDLELAR